MKNYGYNFSILHISYNCAPIFFDGCNCNIKDITSKKPKRMISFFQCFKEVYYDNYHPKI